MSEYKKELAAHIKAGRKYLSYKWWEFAGENAKAIVLVEASVWLFLIGFMVYLAIFVLFPLLQI